MHLFSEEQANAKSPSHSMIHKIKDLPFRYLMLIDLIYIVRSSYLVKINFTLDLVDAVFT